ncbi:MAG TPA: PRC-barrel domain-containing protein [Gemmatimonadaceae bacterium]|jgi:hypothetical protein
MKHDRESRDAAGVGPYAREREHLVPMSTLSSWTVTEGEPDIRGWEVRTVSGRQLGNVADLLVDRAAGEVVLLDIDLPATDRHTFVPIRVVQIDRGKRLILMDSADLPDSEMMRDEPDLTTRRIADAGAGASTVEYPRTDREVELQRPIQADDMRGATAAEIEAAERRRGDRRRIERLSTDL